MTYLGTHNARKIIQWLAFIYILGIGVRFIFYINNIKTGNLDALKPYGVEGFLPISALLGLKQFIMTGEYDFVHPAALSILLAVAGISILFKKSFCSHICPVGTLSEAVSSWGKKMVIPVWLPIWLVKYLLLGFFLYMILWSMDLHAVQMFIRSPYNVISDAKMLNLFLPPSLTTLMVITGLLLLTLLFKNFWCKYLCPYGALLGICSVLSPVKVKRNIQRCSGCKKCSQVCPAGLKVYSKNTVHHPDCIGCLECVKNCPGENCLQTTVIKPGIELHLAVIGIFLIFIGTAMVSGHWKSAIDVSTYKRFLELNINHP